MLMLLGVLLGAFGAHALKARLTPEMLAVYQTGVQYHLAHALGLMLVGFVSQMQRNTQSGELPGSSSLKTAAILMGVGIVLFSGSLYALVCALSLHGRWWRGICCGVVNLQN
jgi:uncharacterized membrane protein YgdD (TMEM256/DUF423 family)